MATSLKDTLTSAVNSAKAALTGTPSKATLSKDIVWETVSSSTVEKIAYMAGDLYVQFRSGKAYRYIAVPEAQVIALRNAKSIGAHLNAEIKGEYVFESFEN